MGTFELQAKLFELFEKGDYQEAIQVANRVQEISPEMKYKTYFWRACLNCSLDQISNALIELNQGLEEGVWWNPNTLMNDPDLKLLHNKDEFNAILNQCEERLRQFQSKTKPETMLLLPLQNSINAKLPILYSIHWRGDNIKRFSQYWDIKKLRDDYIFAFPQSSQVYGYNEYCWDNQENSKKEAKETLDVIRNEYDLRKNEVILAGALQGGKLALELALENEISNVRGFLIVVPSIRDIEQYEPFIEKAKINKLRGCIITGDQDHFYHGAIKLQTEFESRHFPCKLIIKEGMGHFFPNDFSVILPQAIGFILQTSE
jgi:hypothetical protein